MSKWMDEVKDIEARIAALPAEYQLLLAKESVWAHKHPFLYGLILVGTGVLIGYVAPHV